MYEHGGGIDAPLGVVRMEFSDVLHDPQVIFPFHTWRGSYDGGITQGQCAYYTTNGTQLAPAPDSTPTEGDTQYRVHANSGYGSTAEHCVTVDWPAAFMLSARQLRRGYAGPDAWMGSLIFESRDASGLYYRRNRYYDSEKQRFTQEDPIGIAGGINVYGFANGDPVSYSDPYGLSGCQLSPLPELQDCLKIVVQGVLNTLSNFGLRTSRLFSRLSGASDSYEAGEAFSEGRYAAAAGHVAMAAAIFIPAERAGGAVVKLLDGAHLPASEVNYSNGQCSILGTGTAKLSPAALYPQMESVLFGWETVISSGNTEVVHT